MLAASAAAVVGGGAAPADEGVDAIARKKGVRFGSAVGMGPPGASAFDDAGYRHIVARECGLIVAENEHKWYVLRPSAQAYDFSRADRLAAFAGENGLGLRGHTLLWNRDEYSAKWLLSHDFGPQPRAAAEKMLTDHIGVVARRYPQVDSWDVVNETIDPSTGALRETLFGKLLGPELIDLCFHTARAAAPKARLVYNDYMNFGPTEATHRAGVLKLLEGLKARNVPIDALGIQGHIGGGVDSPDIVRFSAADQREWRAFIDEVRGMGLDLLITELDVNDKAMPAAIAPRDAAVASLTKDFLDLMLDYRELKQVLVWGMVDRYSWLQGTSPRPDGLPKRPLPYDADLRAKPMRDVLAAAFRAAPERQPWA
jgi:endo-1,4-beta-xylanase